MAYSNGRIPDSALASISAGRLTKRAAKAWNAMNGESQARFGVTLIPTGSMSSYRTYAQQQYLWNLYKSGRGNLAAQPGTSNHGWGVAVDLRTTRMRQIVDQIGEKYGFAKKWSDAPSEWWHIKWKDGNYHAVNYPPFGHRVIKPGNVGKDVLELKKAMWHAGLRRFRLRTPVYGPTAVNAIKRLQRKHGLKADGIVGPKTWALLK